MKVYGGLVRFSIYSSRFWEMSCRCLIFCLSVCLSVRPSVGLSVSLRSSRYAGSTAYFRKFRVLVEKIEMSLRSTLVWTHKNYFIRVRTSVLWGTSWWGTRTNTKAGQFSSAGNPTPQFLTRTWYSRKIGRYKILRSLFCALYTVNVQIYYS